MKPDLTNLSDHVRKPMAKRGWTLQPIVQAVEHGKTLTRVLAGEPAWPAEGIPEVVDRLRQAGLAVVGVELWRDEGSHPRWVASSNYQCDRGAGWPRYVECCANEALAFVQRFGGESEALFNLTWIGKGEDLR